MIHMPFHHHWPYPTTKREVAHLGILLLIALLLVGLGTSVWVWHKQQTPLSSQEIRLTADELASYAGEAAMLVSVTTDQSLTKHYRTTYTDQLHKQIQKSRKKLADSSVAPDVTAVAHQLVNSADQIDRLVTTFPPTGDTQAARQYDKQLRELYATIQATEKQL